MGSSYCSTRVSTLYFKCRMTKPKLSLAVLQSFLAVSPDSMAFSR